jgi:hypothetical protein
MQTVIQILMQPADHKGWLLSPQALWTRMKARTRRANAEAQIEHTLGEAAEYAARMVGNDMERSVVLSRVDRLRDQMKDQLEVLCREQGMGVPEPYSREEAYCLHLLTAYYVSLAEAQKVIAKRGAALAHRQIELQGEKAEASIDIKILPELVNILSQIDPLREGFLRERVRHKCSMLVSGFIGAVGGILWGIIEGINSVFIAGIARYAPVVAPALLVGLISLVAQTVVNGTPLDWAQFAQYLIRALWNAALASGATLVAYGVWQYFTSRDQHHEEISEQSEVDWEGHLNDIKAADEAA